VRPRPLVPLVLIVALAATACGNGGDDPGGSTTAGDTGTTTQAQADEAMSGLCDIAAGDLTEMADVHEAFHGRAHEILHHVAAEVQEVDPVVAGTLLEAKSVVETDLQESVPTPDLPAHAAALAVAFADTLETIGLQVSACDEA
jgi:hypothetical protein